MLGGFCSVFRREAMGLLLFVCLSVLPAGAQYGGGSGTASSPYLIYTAQQLDAIGANPNHWGKHFKLMADIDLSTYGSSEFHVIGTSDAAFTGVFDGNYKHVSNLEHASDLDGCLGLFGVVSGSDALIENLTLASPQIVSEVGRYLGALVGLFENGTVSNCHVRDGNVEGLSYVGGLIGKNDAGVVLDCTAQASVAGTSRAGGLIGQSYYSTIERCEAQGEVVGSEGSYWIGGLVGECGQGTVKDCRACCTVEGDSDVGGLLGRTYMDTVESCCSAGVVRGGTDAGGLVGINNGGTIRDCYSTADVKATIYAGGLVGCNGANCHCIVYVPGSILRCYACGPVWSVDSGGLVGVNDRSGTKNSFWDKETTGCDKSDGGVGKSTAEMGRESLYLLAGWDWVDEKANGTEDLWYMPDEGGCPRLAWELAKGDLNNDGQVDFRDFSQLAAQWRQVNTTGFVGFDALTSLTEVWLAARQ